MRSAERGLRKHMLCLPQNAFRTLYFAYISYIWRPIWVFIIVWIDHVNKYQCIGHQVGLVNFGSGFKISDKQSEKNPRQFVRQYFF